MSRDDKPRAIVPTEVIPAGQSPERRSILDPAFALTAATQEAIKVVDSDLATFDPEAAKAKLKNYRNFMDWLREFALSKTEPRHWVDYAETTEGDVRAQGQPWLRTHGAEAVADVAAISCGYIGEPVDETGEDEGGPWFLRRVRMWFVAGPRRVETMGTASSRDPFLSHGGTLSQARVDRSKIYRKADSRCKRNGFCEILGMRGLTWEDVERITEGRVTAEQVQRADFKRGRRGSATKGADGDKATPKQVGWILDTWCKLQGKDREKDFSEFGDWVQKVLNWDYPRKWVNYSLEDVRKLKAELERIEAGDRSE